MESKSAHTNRMPCRYLLISLSNVWYLWMVFTASIATCSLSVLPDVRASRSYSLAEDLEKCCMFDPPTITNCSWRGEDDSVTQCNILKYSDSGLLGECYYPLSLPKKNQYPQPAQSLNAEPFSAKCLPKESSNETLCSKYYNHNFSGLNITVTVSPYTAIFTQGLMISLVGITLHTRHLYYRFCRVLEFESSPEFALIESGHLFFYDGFRWLEPGSTYQVTARTLPIDNTHDSPIYELITLPDCSKLSDNYYCNIASLWQPSELTVDPDWQTVNVTFDLAPDKYHFDRYCLMLKDAKDNKTAQQKDVYPDEVEIVYKKALNGSYTTCIRTMIQNVSSGNYIVQLQPRPTNNKVCVGPLNTPTTCKRTGSRVFYVAGPSHTITKVDPIEVNPDTSDNPNITDTPGKYSSLWLPILLGCIAGILALVLLFFMVHRSQNGEPVENSSGRIWKIPMSMTSLNYDPKQEAQTNLQTGLDLTALKEQEFKLQSKQEQEIMSGGRVSSEHQNTAGMDPQEIQPLLQKTDDSHDRSPCHGGAVYRTNSVSTMGYTAEFMNLMQGQVAWRNSRSSLGTVDIHSVYKGSQTHLHRHNSKPDLVSMWWDKCPLLTRSSNTYLKRISNSCPNLAELHHEHTCQNV